MIFGKFTAKKALETARKNKQKSVNNDVKKALRLIKSASLNGRSKCSVRIDSNNIQEVFDELHKLCYDCKNHECVYGTISISWGEK